MALEVLSIVITPVNELGKYLVRKFKTELRYVTEYNSYFSKFHEELLQLQERRDDVQKDVEKARRELKEPRKQVLNWVERVENLEKECMPLTLNSSGGNKCLGGFHCSRRRTSKQLLKMTKDICSLQEKGSFTDIADLPPSLDVVPMGPRGKLENIQSRELIMKEVMKALKDDNIRSIGVHGMGGIGKTTLVTSVNDELCVTRSFKKVIMVTVSKDPDMKEIQNVIAERLDLKLEKEDMPTRAYALFKSLRSKESVLIILDDVWKVIELGEIGLGHSTKNMPCKLIVTTRNANVCSGMEVQKVIKMDILPEDEAWTLFAAKAGNVVVEMPGLEPTAREIVRRCKGSPLAIATLGSTLRTENEEPIWAHALQVLQAPNAMGLEDIMPEAVTSLKWSYDHLKNKPNVQLCFLYCCLFPEDYSIQLKDLRNYGIGEGFLKMATSLEEAHNELLRYVKILKDCCLLLDGNDKSSVKMHDVVRDVAIWIASNNEDGNGFLINVGGGSKYLPESDKLHIYKRISYMRNKDMSLPNKLECPQLRSLLVPNSRWEQNFSFEGVKSLLVLDLSFISESISQLKNLRTLYLDDCELVDKMYLLGGLTKLEVLSMRGSEIGELPVEFGHLINLKLLNLSFAHIDFVAPKVFSRLSNMEELYIDKSFCGWGSTEADGRRNAELIEVLSLPRLSVLDIVVWRPLLDGEVLNYHNLQNFRISVDHGPISDEFCCDMNMLNIGSTDLGKHWISNLLAVSNKNLDLSLWNCCGFKSVTDLNPAGSFNHLQYLALDQCNDVESVIVADRSTITAPDSFEILESLQLHGMDKMEKILHGATSSRNFFGKLEVLVVCNCSKICTIFPSNLLSTEKRLENLRLVRVEQCDEVQHIFNTEDNEFGATPATTALLCGITRILLSFLTKLKSIWKGIMPEGSFQGLTDLSVVECHGLKHVLPSDVARLLQNLEKIHIQNCDAMETITYPIGEEAEETPLFPRCRLLTIKSCPKLKNIFSFGVARHLNQLNTLSISHCHGLRQVFGNGDEPTVTEHQCLLPDLKYLELVGLMSLTRFNQDNLPISGPLQEIKVFVCPNLTGLPLQTVSDLKFIHAEDIWFRKLELVDESQVSMLKPFFQPYFQAIPVPFLCDIDEKLHSLLWKVAGLWLDDYDSQLEGTTHFRRLLSGKAWDMPIRDVNKSGVVPCLVEFLTREDHTQRQTEAAWVLANIASRSSDYTKLVIDHGALPIFVKLLCSPNEDIIEHAILALGNIASHSPEHGHGVLIPLLAQLNDCDSVSTLSNALRTIYNIFAMKPQPPFKQMELALPALQRLIYSSDERVCSDACRALSCLLDGTSDKIKAVTEAGVFNQLMDLLTHPSPLVLSSALHAVGNVVCRGKWQTPCFIDRQALPCLLNLLTHHDATIKKDACHIISNITSGSKEWIRFVIEAKIIAPVVQLLETAESDVKKEAARAILNATFSGSQEYVEHLVEQGCIKPFCDLLQCSNSSIVVLCVRGLFNILKVGETGGLGVLKRYVEIIDDSGGFKNIADHLQGHHNAEIQTTVRTLQKYHFEYIASVEIKKYIVSQSGNSESQCVEKGFLRSTELGNPASDSAKSNKPGTIHLNGRRIRHFTNKQAKHCRVAARTNQKAGTKSSVYGKVALNVMLHTVSLANAKENNSQHHEDGGNTFKEVPDMIDPDNPPLLLYARDSWSKASAEQYTFKVGPGTNNNKPLLISKPIHKNANKIGFLKKERRIIVRKHYEVTGVDDPSCMTSLGNAKIDLNNPLLSPYARDNWSKASLEQYTFKVGPGTNNNRPLLRPKPINKNASEIGLVKQEKRISVCKHYGIAGADDPSCMTSLGNAKIDLKNPQLSPYVRDSWNKASVEQYTFKVGLGTKSNKPFVRPKPINKNGSKIGLVKKEKPIIVHKGYGMTGEDDPLCMTSFGYTEMELD